jgi:hypothetical protein
VAGGETAIGIGTALRRARAARGLSVDEAARDTRIRAELLDALEEEAFDRLLGDVYVRGCLRSYAAYLGLSPDRVVARYADEADGPGPAPVAQPLPPSDPSAGGRRRDNHLLIGMIAATLLILAAAFGLLSGRNATPPPAPLSSSPAMDLGAAADRTITVGVMAERPVDVVVRIDDSTATAPIHLRAGEGRSFQADGRLSVRLSDGGAADVTVNGRELGTPGPTGEPWRKTFSFETSSATNG